MRASSPLLWAAFAWLPLAAADVAAQPAVDISPSNYELRIPRGKVGTIKVKVTDGCTPLVEPQIVGANVVVLDSSPGPGKSKTIRVFPKNNAHGKKTEIQLDLIGIGTGCAENVSYRVKVFVADDDKTAARTFRSGDKNGNVVGLRQRFKDYKSFAQQITSNLRTDINELRFMLGNGGLDAAAQAAGLTPSVLALTLYADKQLVALDELHGEYFRTLGLMANDGYKALARHGMQTATNNLSPRDFRPGGAGQWDAARRALFQMYVQSMRKINSDERAFHKEVQKRPFKEGEPLLIATSGVFVSDPGDASISPVSGGKQFAVDKSRNPAAVIRQVKAWNRITDSGFTDKHGRFLVSGRVGGVDVVTVTFQRLNSNGADVGPLLGGPYAVDTQTSSFLAYWPRLTNDATLIPGTYRITVIGDGDNRTSQLATIPGS